MNRIDPLIRDVLSTITALRHEIHANPELGFEERETARRVVEHLQKLPNLKIKTGVAKTGVVALLNEDKPGKCVALRADMDCLPILEENDVPYKSKVPGKMHACGHDGHTATLVGAATVLSKIADELPGQVKFIFQPAEEGGGGGEVMCNEGVLDNPKVDAIFALHGWPMLDMGVIGVRGGPSLAATNPWEITIHGVGGHAAYPHKCIDPIVVGAHIVTALQTIASRSTDPLDSVVVTCGKFHAGTAVNIIAPTAELAGTIRTLRPETRTKTIALVKQVAEQTAAALGARADVRIRDGYPAVINDMAASEMVADVARETVGAKRVDTGVPPSMGGEDFAYYAQRIPGAFWRLGVGTGEPAKRPQLHQPTYNFPDEALADGVRMHCEIARRFLISSNA